MKKILFLAIALFATTAAFAQDGPRRQEMRREFNPENFARMQTERLHEVLQLDSIQYQAIFLINYADALTLQDSMKVRRERAEKMRAEGKKPERIQPNKEEFEARMELEKHRREARNAQMQQILTEEQYKKYIEYNEKAAKRRFRPGNAPQNRRKKGERRE